MIKEAEKTLGDAKKMLEKTKKHWVTMTLGDQGVGNQDVGQPRHWATRHVLAYNTLGSRSV